MIYDFINEICDILNIPVPSVSFDNAKFQTDTMMAQCSRDGSVICLKKYDKTNPDQLFSIAHELRHVWQIKNDEAYYLNDYKTVKECINITEYNLQSAEIDANAFAAIVMSEFFGITPQFNGLDLAVKDAINKRIKEIVKAGI